MMIARRQKKASPKASDHREELRTRFAFVVVFLSLLLLLLLLLADTSHSENKSQLSGKPDGIEESYYIQTIQEVGF